MPPRRRAPFKGPTDKRTIQTFDVGTGLPDRFTSKAKQFPKRSYLATDPNKAYDLRLKVYSRKELMEKYELDKYINIDYQSEDGLELLKKMIKEKKRIRYINFDMPAPNIENYTLEQFLELAKQILEPNGKIYFTSENENFLNEVAAHAGYLGYKAEIQMEYPADPKRKQQFDAAARAYYKGILKDKPLLEGHPATETMIVSAVRGYELKRLILTYSLKTAFPNKEERRKWPNV